MVGHGRGGVLPGLLCSRRRQGRGCLG
eukprot:SAG25_NODE_264_length_10707_cov_19.216043_1_plen_26_part_10